MDSRNEETEATNYSPRNETRSMEERSNVRSERLLENMEERVPSDTRRILLGREAWRSLRMRLYPFLEDDNFDVPPTIRRFYLYFLILLLIFLLIVLNFAPIAESETQINDAVIFSTYYTSKYRICLPPKLSELYNKYYPVNEKEEDFYKENRERREENGEINEKGERCVEGNVDITLFYKDVNLEGYYRVYAAMSFELDYQGKWYHFWKKRHFFSTKKKFKRLIIALSNLISVEHNVKFENIREKMERERDIRESLEREEGNPEAEQQEREMFEKEIIEKEEIERQQIEKDFEKNPETNISLSSLVPNFINVSNLPKEYQKKVKGEGGNKIKKEDNTLLNSIRLNRWNEFAKMREIKNYNMDIHLKVDPIRYFNSTSRRNLSKPTTGKEKTKKRLKSFRIMDEFYLINLRKYVQNEYKHLANFDISTYNVFNVLKTSNPYTWKFAKNTKTEDFYKDDQEVEEREQVTQREDRVEEEVLKIFFNPENNSNNNSNNNNNSNINNNNTNNDNSNNNNNITGNNGNNNSNNGNSKNNTGNSNNFDNNNGGGGEEREKSDLVGLMENEEGIRLYFKGFEKDMKKLSKMISVFTVFFVAKCVTETLLMYRQFSRVDRGGMGRSVSITSLCLLSYQEVLEIFLLLYHGGVFFDNLIHFGLLMILKFFLLCVVHQNFIVLVWRATHSYHIRQGWVHTQNAFVLFYKYYFTFVVIFVVTWYFFYGAKPVVISAAYVAWFPQIMLDVWRGQNNSLDFVFILMSIVLKLAFPFYIFYFKDNVFNYDQFSTDSIQLNRNLVYFLVFLSSLQLILISLQRLYGPRHFASWSILPKIYSYVRPWSKMMQDDPQECVICMYNIVQSNRDWYLTPCDHLFHANCLREWTSIKLECPNCRRPLPPISQI